MNPSPVRELHRSETERQIAGVCGGIADHFGVDPTPVRVVMVVLALSGPGILLYPLLWLVAPAAPPAVAGRSTVTGPPERADPAA